MDWTLIGLIIGIALAIALAVVAILTYEPDCPDL